MLNSAVLCITVKCSSKNRRAGVNVALKDRKAPCIVLLLQCTLPISCLNDA
jgi:hypothetical protein